MSDSPQSPPKEVEQGVQSPDEEAQMNDPQDLQAGLAYEFEVKEQDRWLPIANGAYQIPFLLRPDSRACALLCLSLVCPLHSYRPRAVSVVLFILALKEGLAYRFVHVPRLASQVARGGPRVIL